MKTPGRLVALESETSFDLSFALSIDLCLILLRAIYLQYLSPPSGMTVSLVVHTTTQVVVVVVVAEPVPCALVMVMIL
jgi:hypothetical protein